MTATLILCLLLATGSSPQTSRHRSVLSAARFASTPLDLILTPQRAQRVVSTPTNGPSQSIMKAPALPLPVPVPTPAYDPRSYIKVPSGSSITVRAKPGEDLAAVINAAQNRNVATVKVTGGGSITNQVRLRHHTVFDSSTYSCDSRGRDE
jgi:hypothetical protein